MKIELQRMQNTGGANSRGSYPSKVVVSTPEFPIIAGSSRTQLSGLMRKSFDSNPAGETSKDPFTDF